MTNGLKTLTDLCLKKLKINKKRVKKLFDKSLCTGTIFAPYLGYNRTAEIIKSALKNNRTIKEELIAQNIFSKKEIDEILSINSITKPKEINRKLIKKSQ